MKSNSTIARSDAGIWERVMDFERELSPTAARALLQIRFSSRKHDRMSALLEKGRSGELTAAEEKEMDAYEQLGCLLGVLHSKARQVLKKHAANA